MEESERISEMLEVQRGQLAMCVLMDVENDRDAGGDGKESAENHDGMR